MIRLRAALREITELKNRLEKENVHLRREIELKYRHETIVGESSLIKKMLHEAERVAKGDTYVLIQGETGTGKELLARAIHNMSPRKGRSMVTVNCAALPPTLIESELFGREKGAFTGAVSRQQGRFEAANGSTLFLDEIGDLPLELQAKLLRVLEDGRFERLGSSETISVDVRVIAATNQDLADLVKERRFRRDLYYRLNVFPIFVPPLRDRREDIPLLVWAFVRELEQSMGKTITNIPKRTMDLLRDYSWPGNVRELRNVVERAMILTTGTTLHIDGSAHRRPRGWTNDDRGRGAETHHRDARRHGMARQRAKGRCQDARPQGVDAPIEDAAARHQTAGIERLRVCENRDISRAFRGHRGILRNR